MGNGGIGDNMIIHLNNQYTHTIIFCTFFSSFSILLNSITMPKKPYYPYFRAEDNFKITRFGNRGRSCLWNNEADPDIIPKEWKKETFKKSEDKFYRAKKAYFKHLDILEQCFEAESSPFEVKPTRNAGLGVYAKRAIKKNEFNARGRPDALNSLLCGFITSELVHGEQTHSALYFKVKRNGVRKTCKNYIQEEWRNLYGPMVFLNHACDDHAHFKISQRSNAGPPFLRMVKDARKGGQLFIDYNTNSFTCAVCGKKTE